MTQVSTVKGVTVRSARPGEEEAVARVTVSGFTARAEISVQGVLPVDLVAAYRDTAQRMEDGDLLVAVDDVTQQIVGTASLLWSGTAYARFAGADEAELRFVTVLPAYRGGGIAHALAAEAIQRALGWGVSAVVLSAREQAAGSQRVYQRLGFVRDPRRERKQPGRLRYWVFERRLVADEDRDLSIRMIRREEIDDVTDLLLTAYSTDYAIPDGYRQDLAAVQERARDHEVWVAVDHTQHRIVGTLTTPRAGSRLTSAARDGEMDLRVLAVAPDARGRGVASRLMRHAVDQAQARGARRIVLTTGPEMVGAQRLYERLGFERMRDRETEVINGVRLLVYGFDLVDPEIA